MNHITTSEIFKLIETQTHSPAVLFQSSHGGPHWDVVSPDGKNHNNVYPKGKQAQGENNGNNKITLILTPLKFYSNDDEDLFFEWIKKIKCVDNYKGIGKELHVYIQSNQISFNDFKNLKGIFKRYKLKNPDQLKQFINENTKESFDL